ncbi:MAG: toxin-antitoxin system, antitoxin component, Xre family protein [Thermodesulfobacteriota bacterium]
MHHENEVLLTTPREKELLVKIRSLPPDLFSVVEQFVDSLGDAGPERRPASRIPTPSPADPFTQIWNNPEDAEYDSV